MDMVELLERGGPAVASHHTKDKGDLGVVAVIHDMVEHDIRVFLPMSEHQPIDLIAMNRRGDTSRVQVKHRKMLQTGVIEIQFRSTWSDSHGSHQRATDFGQFDCYAVYCPDNGKVYYIRNDEISNKSSLKLRILPPKNGQQKGVIGASQFLGVRRIF
jgi:hypothetical protein